MVTRTTQTTTQYRSNSYETWGPPMRLVEEKAE